MTLRNLARFGLGAVVVFAGCGEDSKDPDGDAADDETPAAACPAELSYEKTAGPFIEEYCIVCHSEKAADALGDGHIFDSEELVREHGEIMYEQVLTGAMPKTGPKPPDPEKRDFLEWLECSGATAAGADHDHDHGK